ncbi:MAG: DUF63 family protein [Candidatus Aenigmarchaeota archaeon]|nr:DUF63 family protein [Candidatus Aenigmarchaeota archaeon]
MGFFETYFIDPITHGTGYNIYNTTVYAILLVISAVIVYKVIKKMGITIDRKFLFAVTPYMFLGGLMRALQDAKIFETVFLITPLIYVSIFLLTFVALVVSRLLNNKIAYYKTWFGIGAVLSIAALSFVKLADPAALLLMLGITAVWAVAIFAAKWIAEWKGVGKIRNLLTTENSFLLLAHEFDATTTFVATTFYPYFEQHVLPSFFISLFGTWFMFVLKFVVVVVVLHVLDKELSKPEDLEKRTFLKFLVLVLGMAPGLRNFFRLIMGV